MSSEKYFNSIQNDNYELNNDFNNPNNNLNRQNQNLNVIFKCKVVDSLLYLNFLKENKLTEKDYNLNSHLLNKLTRVCYIDFYVKNTSIFELLENGKI